MKISASLYSYCKDKSLESLVKELDSHNIDMFHIDCADDESVFEDIQKIRSLSNTPIDLHIISEHPEKYFDRIEELRIEYVCFQYENLKKLPKLPKSKYTHFGLSFVSDTPTDIFEKAKDSYSFALMMATAPGVSGGVFNGKNFRKIIAFRNRFPQTKVHVDGGINDQIAFILRLLGADVIVSGSYLVNHDSIGAGIRSFHKTPNGNAPVAYKLSDFSTPAADLPVINESDVSFKSVLELIDQYKQGFALVTDSNGRLSGVISNADVRKGLLRNLDELNEVKPDDIINRNPISIREDASLTDMIRLLNNLNFIVLFLPVIDAQKKLKGAVLLNRLTRV